MYPSFPYSELQKRFCEGFTFFPFKALEQHGGYIYKRYRKDDNTPELLEQCDNLGNYSGLHAQVLLLKLLQRDIPLAGVLLSEMQSGSCNLEKVCYTGKERSVLCEQLLETMKTYQSVLAIYKHHVMEQMATQLSELCNTGDSACIEEVTRQNLVHIRLVVQEFLNSTEIICTLLSGWLALNEQQGLRDMLKKIAEFRDLQKKTIHVLEQWKQEDIRYKEQQAMN